MKEESPAGHRIFYLKIECEDALVETIKALCNDLNIVLPAGNQIITGIEYKTVNELFESEAENMAKSQTVKDLYAAIKAAMTASELDNHLYDSQRYRGHNINYMEVDGEEVKVTPEQKEQTFDFNFRGKNFRVSEQELRDPNSKNLGNFLRHMAQSTNRRRK